MEKISSDKSLLSILRNYTQLGQFRVEKPVISLVLREGGSNVEDLMANFKSETPEKKSSTNVAIDLAVVDGTVKITDQSTKQSWQIDKVNVDLSMPADAAQAMTLKATAEVSDAAAAGQTGRRHVDDIRAGRQNNRFRRHSGAVGKPAAGGGPIVCRPIFAPSQARRPVERQRPRDLGRR